MIVLGTAVDIPDATTPVRLLFGTCLLFVMFATAGIYLLLLPRQVRRIALAWLLWIPGAAFVLVGASPIANWHPWVVQHSSRAGSKVVTSSHSELVAEGTVLIAIGAFLLATWAVFVIRDLRKHPGRTPRRIVFATNVIALVVLIAFGACEVVSLRLANREPAGLATYGPTVGLQPGASMSRAAATAELNRYYGDFTPFTRTGASNADSIPASATPNQPATQFSMPAGPVPVVVEGQGHWTLTP
ncbi:hypothetical protein [Flexivirga caeni]|uniref:Uncharacterized protein n=1 Tax=Flexivirga caeni TaxID=2294115 RepID=A0A3M9ME08_9MICO|nr:hypothetical protein [Flexivirga caeni]RNI23073.1 hypothetical protein EFY87_07970 [Flexivirga caeni]